MKLADMDHDQLQLVIDAARAELLRRVECEPPAIRAARTALRQVLQRRAMYGCKHDASVARAETALAALLK